MKSGWIYVLTNPSMPNLVKVGLTTTSPDQRLREISSATGVASKFQLDHVFKVNDVNSAESKAHRILEKIFGRPNKSREFFSASSQDAYEVLSGALQEFFEVGDSLALRDAEKKVRMKSFSMACLEFEAELPKAVSSNGGRLSPNLASFYGVYFAACAAIERTPIMRHEISGNFSHEILEKAIEISSEFTNEPEDLIIGFSRLQR